MCIYSLNVTNAVTEILINSSYPPSPPSLPLPRSSPRGYMYAGLEFGAECYCGHKIQAPNASDSECSMECKGEKSNLCGGANRLSIYRLELSQESARRCESDTSATAPQRPRPCVKGKGVLGLSDEAYFS